MKIGELRHRIFSFNKAGHRDIAMSPPSALAKSIAALRFKILTKIKEKIHGSKFAFHTGWSIRQLHEKKLYRTTSKRHSVYF